MLQPGESLGASFFVGAGLNGWDLAEPGAYWIQVSLQAADVEVAATPLRLRIASPRSWDEELVAQDFFTSEVGRALAFGGTYAMTAGIEALQEAADRLKGRAVALHSMLALALPRMHPRKELHLPEGEAPMSSIGAEGGKIALVEARPDEAQRMLQDALLSDRGVAARTFGRSAHGRYVDMYASWLEQCGDKGASERAREKKSKRTPKA